MGADSCVMTLASGGINVRNRPLLAMIDEQLSDDAVRVTVVLGWQDRAFEGEAQGEPEDGLRPRLVGEATLRAVERVAAGRLLLDLTAVATTDLGDARIAMAQVRADSSPDSLVGSAMIRENDPSKATARAVLDAINRKLEMIIAATESA